MHVLRAKIYTKLIVVCGFLIALTDCRNKKDVPITSTVCAKITNMFSSGLVEAEFQSQWKQMPWPKLFKSSVNSLWKVSFRRRSFYVSYQWPWFSPFLSERNVCRQSHSFYVVFCFFLFFRHLWSSSFLAHLHLQPCGLYMPTVTFWLHKELYTCLRLQKTFACKAYFRCQKY